MHKFVENLRHLSLQHLETEVVKSSNFLLRQIAKFVNYAVIRKDNSVLFKVCFGLKILYVNFDFVLFPMIIRFSRNGHKTIVIFQSRFFANFAIFPFATVVLFFSYGVCEMKKSDYGIVIVAVFELFTG